MSTSATSPGAAYSGRREFGRTVLGCVVGACTALLAVTRTWAVQVVIQPAPLPAAHLARAGTFFVPWVSALALVGLAGSGALLATRGSMRSVVGLLILLAGVGVVAGGVYGVFGVDHVRLGWPLLCIPAGLLLAGGGAFAASRGAGWPTLGARYERAGAAAGHDEPADDESIDEYEAEIDEPVERSGPSPSEIAMWDALDRGEDPSR